MTAPDRPCPGACCEQRLGMAEHLGIELQEALRLAGLEGTGLTGESLEKLGFESSHDADAVPVAYRRLGMGIGNYRSQRQDQAIVEIAAPHDVAQEAVRRETLHP